MQNRLLDAISHDRAPHAILISGPEGSGKRELARRCAALFCLDEDAPERLVSCPNYYAIGESTVKVGDIRKLTVWGNPSPTMYADYRFATVNGESIKDKINDQVWNKDVFLPTVGKRGAAIIAARGLSSAASAANAAIDHMRDWALGSNGEWVTMGVPSNGEYGIPAGIVFGFPVTTENGEYKIVEGLEIDAFSQECINTTLAELQGEQDGVKHLL